MFDILFISQNDVKLDLFSSALILLFTTPSMTEFMNKD